MTSTFDYGTFYANECVCLDIHPFCSFDNWLSNPISENWQLILYTIVSLLMTTLAYLGCKLLCLTLCYAAVFSHFKYAYEYLILYHVVMTNYYMTKSFYKYKSDDHHVNKLTDNDFNKLHWSFCCNFPKSYLLCWHYAWCFK